MKPIIPARTLLAVAAVLTVLGGCKPDTAAKDAASSREGAAAIVNGAPVSENLVAALLKQRTDFGRAVTPEIRASFVDRLVTQLVASQEAVKKGMDKSPEVAAQLEMNRHSILANAYIMDFLKNNPVSDDMLKTEYEKMKSQSSGREYRARHILLKEEAEAMEVIAALKKNPKQFDALAREKSMDPSSKRSGGELGWFDPKRMVPEFGQAVTRLGKGRFTEEPVKSQFGYHVILLEDSRAAVIQPFEQAKTTLQHQIQQQNLQKHMDGLKAQAKVEIMPPPSAPNPPESKPADAGKR